MKVAMLLHNDFSSDMRVMREASALVDGGWDVTVLCLRGEGLADTEWRDGYAVKRVADRTATGWRNPLRKIAEMRHRASALSAAAIAERPDIVHCHDTDTLSAGRVAASATGAKLVYDAHELFPDMLAGHGRGSVLVQGCWRSLERRLIPQADLVITVSASLAEVLGHRYGVSPVVVRNTPYVEPCAPRRVLRDLIGCDDSAPVVLYQGGLIGGRALHRLVAAMASIPSALLVIEGSGPAEDALREVAAASGCADRVRFMGWIPPEHLHAHACGADVGVVIYENTSLNNYYAAPNKLYAYLMAGLPMASSDFPGLRDVVVGEGVGDVFDPAGEESIASTLRSLLDDTAGRAQMAARARLLAESRYNWSVDSVRLVEAYERLGT